MTRHDLVASMVADLRNVDVDLGDGRDVFHKLRALGFLAGDIADCLDEVIEETRRLGLKRTWA